MKYFILKNKRMPWGDYGRILFAGLFTVLDDDFNDLDVPEIERTGSYIPDIYIVNSRNIILTDSTKKVIEESNITGVIGFRRVLKKKIVNINWTNWDFNSKSPLFYPKSGEPEGYIFEGINDKDLSHSMPDIWELEFIKQYELKKTSGKPDNIAYSDILLVNTPNVDIFLPKNMLFVIASERFKNLMISHKIDSLEFIELKNEN